ncbi:class I SAM-dependent methyltransferase [Pontibacter locisalis]|uniref:Class I SAM-dependent methyltransferase n=1 Tax=Pontibacter locisalis TaxID=1719035 RepID=A0ABW5ILH8_9BACT
MSKRLQDSGFDQAAPFYDQLSRLVYGSSLQRAQKALLPFLPQQGRVLVIGGGSGWLLEQILRTGKQLDILYLDASQAMLKRAKKKFRKYSYGHYWHVEFRLGTEQQLEPQEQFDIIFTPFLLDLFPPKRLQNLMDKLDAALAPEGLWLFADFWPVQSPPPIWQRILIRGMYVFFGIISGVEAKDLPAYATHFESLGLREIYSSSFFSDMVQAKVFAHQLQNRYI